MAITKIGKSLLETLGGSAINEAVITLTPGAYSVGTGDATVGGAVGGTGGMLLGDKSGDIVKKILAFTPLKPVSNVVGNVTGLLASTVGFNEGQELGDKYLPIWQRHLKKGEHFFKIKGLKRHLRRMLYKSENNF